MNETSSVWNMTLSAFREATAANTSTPSCGAAAVVAADMGLALIVMALSISEAKQPLARRAALLEGAKTCLVELGHYADADIHAFKVYLGTVKDQACSAEETEQAARKATQVPLATARTCIAGLQLAKEALPLIAAPVRSDILSGALLLQAGASAVLLNVDADLSTLHDHQAREEAKHLRTQLQATADQLLAEIRQALTS